MRLVPPTTNYLEGVLDLCYATGIHYCRHPEEGGPNCRTGYYIGRAILQLYAIEMYLRHSLADVNLSSKRVTHHLHKLFKMLPEDKKEIVRESYSESMKRHIDAMPSTWYRETRTVEDFLKFLGKSPITDIRYIWDPPTRHARHEEEDNIDLLRECELDSLLYAVRKLCSPKHHGSHSSL